MISQIPWKEKKFQFDFPVGVFPIIVERLRGTPIRLQAMLRNVSQEKLNRILGDKWSIMEQLNHLCNSEMVWFGRIEDFLSREGRLQPRTLSTAIISNDMPTLLQNFSDARNKLVVKVQDMDEETASLTIIHPRFPTPIRLMDSLFSTAEHDDHHLTKIRELLA